MLVLKLGPSLGKVVAELGEEPVAVTTLGNGLSVFRKSWGVGVVDVGVVGVVVLVWGMLRV